jgi:CarboxypepD_reg-like domain
MKKFILIFLFANFNIVAYNQVIKGTVLENKTNSPIFAAIYFSGTFVGTLSDLNGNFELDISKNASMPLTISSIGYYSVTLTDFLTYKPLIIYMTPKVYEVKEVDIVFLKEKVYFDKEGYFDQTGMSIKWEGDMLDKRVGDMLPYTYKIE